MIRSIGTNVARGYGTVGLFSSIIISAALVPLGFPLFSSFLALILLAICFYPTFNYFDRHLSGIPAIPVILGAYGLQFAAPTFLGDRMLLLVGGVVEVPEQYLISALLLAILGAVTLLVVCNSKLVHLVVDKLPQLVLVLNPTKTVIFCIIFGAIWIALPLFVSDMDAQAQTQYSALFRTLRNQILVAIALLGWLAALTKSLTIKILWYCIIVVASVEGASSASLETALAPIGIMFLCEWIYFRRVRKLLLVAIACGALFLNSVKGEVRENLWYGTGSATSRVEKALLWMDTAAGFWSDVLQGRARGDEAATQLVSRANLIDLLAHVVEQSPNTIPYLNGESYSFFAYAWIPRIIWPDKPEANANRLLAITYNITTPDGAETSTFGISLIGEGYANFGPLGVILIMAVLGLNLLAMTRLFGSPAAGAGGTAIFLSVFIYFLNGLGTSAEILFGNLFQSMLASYFLLYWVRIPQADRTLP